MEVNEVFTVKGVEFKFIKASAKNGGETHVWAMRSDNNKQTQVALDDIDTPIESLSFQMGVDVREVECFAKSVCNSLKQDNISDFYVNGATEEQQSEISQAYAQHAVKKMEQFHTAMLTNTEVQNLFYDMVFAQFKYKWAPAL